MRKRALAIKRDIWVAAKVKVTRGGKVIAKVPATAVVNPMSFVQSAAVLGMDDHLTPKGKAIAKALESAMDRYSAKHGAVNINRHASWDAPEFRRARKLLSDAGAVWDFSGWGDVLEMLHRPAARIGGVSFARRKKR